MPFDVYKLGIKTLSPTPTGAGGIVLNDNFEALADLVEAKRGNGVQTLSGTGTLLATTDVLELDSTAAPFTVTIPLFANGTKPCYIDNIGTGGNQVDFEHDGSELFTVADGELWLLYKGSTEWRHRRIG